MFSVLHRLPLGCLIPQNGIAATALLPYLLLSFLYFLSEQTAGGGRRVVRFELSRYHYLLLLAWVP